MCFILYVHAILSLCYVFPKNYFYALFIIVIVFVCLFVVCLFIQCCEGDGIVGTISERMIRIIRQYCRPVFDSLFSNFAEELISSVADSVSLFT